LAILRSFLWCNAFGAATEGVPYKTGGAADFFARIVFDAMGPFVLQYLDVQFLDGLFVDQRYRAACVQEHLDSMVFPLVM